MLKMSVKNLCTVVALVIAFVLGGVAAQRIATYRPVTDQQLGNPSTPNWLRYRGTYDGWGCHPADLINTTIVKRLVPVWCFSTGEIGGHQDRCATRRSCLGLWTAGVGRSTYAFGGDAPAYMARQN
jgi:glucose dehydrogenase